MLGLIKALDLKHYKKWANISLNLGDLVVSEDRHGRAIYAFVAKSSVIGPVTALIDNLSVIDNLTTQLPMKR